MRIWVLMSVLLAVASSTSTAAEPIVKTLTTEQAKKLAIAPGDLELNGLTELTDECALALGQHSGNLYLNGLTKNFQTLPQSHCPLQRSHRSA